MNVLHPSLSKSFAFSICSRYPMKNSILGWILLQEYMQPNTSQVTTMMALWKMTTVFCSSSWNFSFPYFVTCFVRQNLQKFTEKVTSKVLFRKIRWENIHFYGLKKEFFISNWRKIQVNSSKKYVNFFSSGYYFPSYISPLMRVMECIELNWLCKHMRKVRSSQAAIMVLIWVKNRFSL